MKAALAAGTFLALSFSLAAQIPSVGASPRLDPRPAASQPALPRYIDPQKEMNIRRLIEISGAKSNFASSLASMSTMMRAGLEKSGMSSEKARTFSDFFFQKMQAKMTSQFDVLLEMLIPVYDKYYTNEDMEGLIAFYDTPLGQKMLKNSSDVTRESQSIGFQWGSKIGQEAEREVLAEHPELKPKPPVFTNQ